MQLILTIFFFGIGAVLGSFICVLAERLNTHQSWWSGRSRCNSCARELNTLDLVPIFSWLSTKGRCRTCKAKIPATYVVVEAVLGILFAGAYLFLGLTISLAFFLIALAFLTLTVVYDLRHTIVPPTVAGLFVVASLAYSYVAKPTPGVLELHVLIAAGIALVFFLLYFLSQGRAMGLGDTPIAFGGALLAGSVALTGVTFSFWIGAIYGIALLVIRPKSSTMKSEVPFVPFLAAGFLLAFFTGWNLFPF